MTTEAKAAPKRFNHPHDESEVNFITHNIGDGRSILVLEVLLKHRAEKTMERHVVQVNSPIPHTRLSVCAMLRKLADQVEKGVEHDE